MEALRKVSKCKITLVNQAELDALAKVDAPIIWGIKELFNKLKIK